MTIFTFAVSHALSNSHRPKPLSFSLEITLPQVNTCAYVNVNSTDPITLNSQIQILRRIHGFIRYESMHIRTYTMLKTKFPIFSAEWLHCHCKQLRGIRLSRFPHIQNMPFIANANSYVRRRLHFPSSVVAVYRNLALLCLFILHFIVKFK